MVRRARTTPATDANRTPVATQDDLYARFWEVKDRDRSQVILTSKSGQPLRNQAGDLAGALSLAQDAALFRLNTARPEVRHSLDYMLAEENSPSATQLVRLVETARTRRRR